MIDREFRAAVRTAKALGLKDNQAVLSANNVTEKRTGSNCLKMFGQTHLIADDQDRYLTPTDIGSIYKIGSPQEVNRRLEESGFYVMR